MLHYDFFINAVAGLAIISVAAAIIGVYIMTRRLVSLAGGITHACFGGLGLGCLLGISPVAMAAVFAAASALGVEWMSARREIREDSAVAVVWSIGMALGILFVFLTPGYTPELNAFLFGNILTISRYDLAVFAIFTVALVLWVVMRHRVITACIFDPDFAKVSHLPYRRVNFVMTIAIAIGIVLTIKLIGIMLLMSMMSLPQMISETFTRRMGRLMVLSIVTALATSMAGIVLATVIDVPCSALIVLTQAAAFLLARACHAIIPRKILAK